MQDIAYGLGLKSQEVDAISKALSSNNFRFSEVREGADLSSRPALVFVGVGGLAKGRGMMPAAYAVATLPEPSFSPCAEALRAGYNDVLPMSHEGDEMRALLARFFIWLDKGRAPENLRPLADMEKQAILSALFVCRGQMSMAARRLGIGRSTLYRKVEQYGIETS